MWQSCLLVYIATWRRANGSFTTISRFGQWELDGRGLNYHHYWVLVIEVINTLIARACIAPENYEEPICYSGHVEHRTGRFEFSPVFDALLKAVAWARERTDFVIARGVSGEYQWYGVGPQPPDIAAQTE
jgi:hypothetical protein